MASYIPVAPTSLVSWATRHTLTVNRLVRFSLLCFLYRTVDGQLYTCGANQFGQLGYQTDFNSKQAGQVLTLQGQRITMVGCGDTFSVAVSEGKLCHEKKLLFA